MQREGRVYWKGAQKEGRKGEEEEMRRTFRTLPLQETQKAEGKKQEGGAGKG
jgi:hypothetical protein